MTNAALKKLMNDIRCLEDEDAAAILKQHRMYSKVNATGNVIIFEERSHNFVAHLKVVPVPAKGQ